MNKGPMYAAINRRKITIFVAILMILMGGVNYYLIPKQECPDITAPFALITVIYPGASPDEVEELITSKIENELVEIEGYDYCRSSSRNSLSTTIFKLDIDADIDKAWDNLHRKMNDLQSELPSECMDIQINTQLDDTAGVVISMSGENYSYEQLGEYAEQFKKELSRLDGVSRFEISGKQENNVVVEVATDRLNHYRFSFDDIVGIIKAQNLSIPAGKLNDGSMKINVNTSGTLNSIEEIENVILDVSPNTGAVVRLKDVADVHFDLEDASYKIKHNGKNAVLLTGYFKKDKNVILIGREVRNILHELEQRLPQDVFLEEVLYQPEEVTHSVNGFVLNLFEGVLFVILVVLVGMGLRNAVIVSTAIPLCIMTTFTMMRFLHIDVNHVSIAALIMSLGMLVDNAIVVSDAIQVRIDNGEDKLKACLQGVKSVAIPVLTSTLTTVAAFIPLLMLPSAAGEYVSGIPKIVIISLSASYLVALFVTPALAYIFFDASKKRQNNSRVRTFFASLLNWGMEKRMALILLAAGAIGLTVLIVTRIGLQFFPPADKDIIYMDIACEKDSNISQTEELVASVSQVLGEQQEITGFTAAIGDGLPKFYITLPPSFPSHDFAQIMAKVDLEKGSRFNNNGELVDFLQSEFDRKICGGEVTVKQLEIGEPIGAPVIVRIIGNDMDRLGEVADQIQGELGSIEGTANIQDDFADRIYSFAVNVDADMASALGVVKYDVQNEVSIALMGRDASTLRMAGNEYAILVKGNLQTKEDIENLAIKSSFTNNKVLLRDVASVRLQSEIPAIQKYNRDITVMVQSDVRTGYSSIEIQKQLEKRLDNVDLSGVKVIFDGEREKIQEHFSNLGSSALIAVALIYAILLLQFYSFVQPLIILLSISLSAMGSIWGLFLLRQPLSFTGLLGLISLFGIVVNNAIILLDFINTERQEGKSIDKACRDAVSRRFRPIMLSTVTTVIGLIPLVLSGSAIFAPMAISLMFGLIVSTVFTLVVIPVVYSKVEGLFETRVGQRKSVEM